MMSCQDAAKLISEQRDHPLSLGQRFGLKLHLAMCALCRGYQKNLEMLGSIAARAGDAVMSAFGRTDGELALTTATKQRMKDQLDKASRTGQ
jgi:hypothetical protein